MNTGNEAITIRHGDVEMSVPLKAVAVALLGKNVPAASVPAQSGVPRIGDSWHGGIYAGVARGRDGASDYHLICGPEADDDMGWEKAKQWASELKLHGYEDYTLPTRKEQALLFANVGDLFKDRWYWSSEQHADDSDYAWGQFFGSGGQILSRKSLNVRVRAVRRVPIQ